LIPYKKIFLGNDCNNKCLYCPFKDSPPLSPDLNSIINALEQAEEDSVYLYGGEPALRADLLEIIFAARRNNCRRIKLVTNGRAFSDINLLLQVINAGCYLFEIKLWASNPTLHDYITQSKGSFWQTISGLENLARLCCPKFICVRVAICRKNYIEIENIVNLALSFNINRLILSFFDDDLRFKEVIPHIKNAINISILNRIWVLTEGFPFCVMNDLMPHVGEIYYGWDRIYHNDYRHHQYCQACLYKAICPGVKIKYLEQFGDREFFPLKTSKYFKDIKALYESATCYSYFF
jgi:hypothetical protein